MPAAIPAWPLLTLFSRVALHMAHWAINSNDTHNRNVIINVKRFIIKDYNNLSGATAINYTKLIKNWLVC